MPTASIRRSRGLDRATQTFVEVGRSPHLAAIGSALVVFALADGLLDVQIAILAAVAAGLIVASVLYSFARTERETRNSADAVLLATRLREFTPQFGTWAIEPDFAALVLSEVEQRPGAIVELGSGSSTMLIARVLKQAGSGRLYSLEHDPHFAEITRKRLEAAGLAERVELIVAPLEPYEKSPSHADWYSREAVARLPAEIDLLVVDGPPSIDAWSRWPVGPELAPRLKQGASMLLDDGRARFESRAARSWASGGLGLELYWHDTVKGTWKLTRRPGRSESGTVRTARAFIRLLNPHPSGFGRWPVRC